MERIEIKFCVFIHYEDKDLGSNVIITLNVSNDKLMYQTILILLSK